MSDLPTGTVTFLFTDIEGSTRILARLRDRYPALLEEHQRLLRDALAPAGAIEVGTEGDSFFVVFPAAPAAVTAAVAAQQSLEGHEWPQGEMVRVRMGLHTGEAILAGDSYTGIDVHRAARIAAAAHGGQVLLSDATQALVAHTLPEGVRLRDLGEHRLKDLSHPEHLYQLLIPGLPQDFPPIRSAERRKGNLPTPLTSFVGRREELDEIAGILAASRLLTLTGPGGAGKTRLSIQAGREAEDRFDDGVFFVPLAAIEEPELVVPTIAQALAVPEDPGRPAIEIVVEHLRDREVLLILDNFEQVTPAAGAVGELLGATEGVKVLATSREPLHLVGEREYAVPPLRLPDLEHLPPLDAFSQYEAVQLFIQRASAVAPGFAVTNENAPPVAEICARLDGLPLAIELAAARVKLLPPDALLERLHQSFSVLASPARDLPERQQTLRAAIAWSYDLLDERERAFFSRLSVFMGGFTLEAAEEVCNPGGELGIDTLDLVASLLDKSLLRTMATGGRATRYLMLQTIREHARERLSEREDADEIGGRHAGYFLGFAERSAPALMGRDRVHQLDLLESEHDNLRSALRWALDAGDASTASRLAFSLWRFWQMRGHLREARERLDEVLAVTAAAEDRRSHADALEAAGGIAYWMGDMAKAAELYRECLDVRRETEDRKGLAEAAYNLACVYVFGRLQLGEGVPARPLLEEAELIFRDAGDAVGLAKVLWAKGSSSYMGTRIVDAAEEDHRASADAFEESLALYRRSGDRFGEAWALHMLGISLSQLARVDDARRCFDEALEIFLEAGDRSAIPILLTDYALLALVEGDGERAFRLIGAAEAGMRELELGIAVASEEVTGVIDRATELLPGEAGERARRAGEGMSIEAAIAYAREGILASEG